MHAVSGTVTVAKLVDGLWCERSGPGLLWCSVAFKSYQAGRSVCDRGDRTIRNLDNGKVDMFASRAIRPVQVSPDR